MTIPCCHQKVVPSTVRRDLSCLHCIFFKKRKETPVLLWFIFFLGREPAQSVVSPVWEASKSCQRSVCQVKQSLPEGQENLFCDPAVPGCPGDEPAATMGDNTAHRENSWGLGHCKSGDKAPHAVGIKAQHIQAWTGRNKSEEGSPAHSAAKPHPPT